MDLSFNELSHHEVEETISFVFEKSLASQDCFKDLVKTIDEKIRN